MPPHPAEGPDPPEIDKRREKCADEYERRLAVMVKKLRMMKMPCTAGRVEGAGRVAVFVDTDAKGFNAGQRVYFSFGGDVHEGIVNKPEMVQIEFGGSLYNVEKRHVYHTREAARAAEKEKT